jgi:hypothetical protein
MLARMLWERKEPLFTAGGDMKEVWQVLKKLKTELPYDPAIPLMDTYPKECKSGYNTDIQTLVFTAAPSSVAKLWNQLKCPLTHECIKKMWFICTVEYYSAIKKNGIMLFSGKCVELEMAMLSEVSQKGKVGKLPFVCRV